MVSDEKPKRKHLNMVERRERKAAEVQIFAKNYARKAQAGGADPNDRKYARQTVEMVRHLRAEELDDLLRYGEE